SGAAWRDASSSVASFSSPRAGSVALSLSVTNLSPPSGRGAGRPSATARAAPPPGAPDSVSTGANPSPGSRPASVDREIGKPIGEGGRKPRANEYPVLAILALEITSDLVKLRKTLTGGKGYEQLDLGEPARDRSRDRPAELLQP